MSQEDAPGASGGGADAAVAVAVGAVPAAVLRFLSWARGGPRPESGEVAGAALPGLPPVVVGSAPRAGGMDTKCKPDVCVDADGELSAARFGGAGPASAGHGLQRERARQQKTSVRRMQEGWP